MTFDEIVELAKNGLGKPSFTYQSEQLAYLTLRNLLLAYRNQLLSKESVLEQKAHAQRLFEQSRLEEERRFAVYRDYQEKVRKCEQLLHQINHEMKKSTPDHSRLLHLMAQVVDGCFGTKYGEELT